MGDDIEMRFNYNRKALGDLGLWLGLVGVTVETLQTSIDALGKNIDGQRQTLNEIVSRNSTAINTLEMSSSAIGDDIKTCALITTGRRWAISV